MKSKLIAIGLVSIVVLSSLVHFRLHNRKPQFDLTVSNTTIADPEKDINTLKSLVTDEMRVKSALGEDIPNAVVSDKQISELMSTYYNQDRKDEISKEANMPFSEFFKKYAKEAYQVTASGHIVGQQYGNLTQADIAQLKLENGINTDLIEKFTDIVLERDGKAIDLEKASMVEKYNYFVNVRNPKKAEAKTLLKSMRDQIIDDSNIAVDNKYENAYKDDFISMTDRAEANEVSKDLENKGMKTEVKSYEDIIDNVDRNNRSLYIGEPPNTTPIQVDKLKDILDNGIVGTYVVDITGSGAQDLYQYFGMHMYDLNLMMDTESQGDIFAEKYNGFQTGSVKSGIAFRISQTQQNLNSNIYILELYYIPEISGYLKEAISGE